MARARHNDKRPTAWIAKQKFEAAEIDIPEWLASRDKWLRYAEEVYPIVRMALTTCGKDDQGVTRMCAQEPEAMVEALQATRDALGKYRQLIDLLATARARMLVGLERTVGEPA